MKPFATAFVLIVAVILIMGSAPTPPKQVNASPAPPPVREVAPDNSAELAALRVEIADLRQQLASRPAVAPEPAVYLVDADQSPAKHHQAPQQATAKAAVCSNCLPARQGYAQQQPRYAQAKQTRQRRNGNGWRPGKFVGKVFGRGG